MGRPRKPEHEKSKTANPSGWAPTNVAPDIEPDVPAPPAHLSEVARQHWDEITPRLDKKRVLDPTFCGQLEIMCEAYARWVHAKKVLDDEGFILTGAKGGQYYHPMLGVLGSAEKTYTKISENFGLDPRHISGVHSKKKDKGPKRQYL